MTDWFRSWHGAPTDPKWLGIARRAGVAPGIAVAVAWALMDRASQASERGSIEGYDADGLACFYGCEPDQVDAIVQAMRDKGMLEHDRFAAWERRQPKREDDSSERVRGHRERNKGKTKRDVTQRNAPETDTETEKKEAPSLCSGGTRAASKGCRLPDDFEPDLEEAQALGLTLPQAISEAAKFKDHWRQASGQSAVKRDWMAAWRNWCRRALEGFRGSRGPPAARTQNGYAVLALEMNGLPNGNQRNDDGYPPAERTGADPPGAFALAGYPAQRR